MRSAAMIAVALPGMSRRRARLSAALTCARVSFAARAGSGALPSELQLVGGIQVVKRRQRSGEVVPQLAAEPLDLPGPFPDHRLMGPRHDLDRVGIRAVPGDGAELVGIGAHHVAQHVRVTSVSLLAPVDTPRRSRYRDACSGFTPYTVRAPAARSAVTHRPRSVSIPITTSASSASTPRCCPTSSCSRAIPATPSGSLLLWRQHPARLIHQLHIMAMILSPVIPDEQS